MGRGGQPKDRETGPERKCIATGEVRDMAGLIRFVVGPDAQIVPDVAGKLPGRGIWVSAERAALDKAVAKGLFARGAKQAVTVPDDLVDQVAIFFLAGHETSASALAWALYLVARDQEVQSQLQDELDDFPASPDFSDLSKLSQTKSVFQETLRLYPPVPMMVREAACPAEFRGRDVPKGAQIVLSPWHLHRHDRLWEDPDAFCPARFGPEATPADKSAARAAYMPFSAGPRVCVGAAFAMTEGILSLAMLLRAFAFQPCTDHVPQPSAQLTLRSANGIHLVAQKRVT